MPDPISREQWEALDFRDFAAEAFNRGRVLVPVQYVSVLMKALTTDYWPALYDADGKLIGED